MLQCPRAQMLGFFMSSTVVQDLKFSLKFFQYFYIERLFDARRVWETLN